MCWIQVRRTFTFNVVQLSDRSLLEPLTSLFNSILKYKGCHGDPIETDNTALRLPCCSVIIWETRGAVLPISIGLPWSSDTKHPLYIFLGDQRQTMNKNFKSINCLFYLTLCYTNKYILVALSIYCYCFLHSFRNLALLRHSRISVIRVLLLIEGSLNYVMIT